MAAIDGDEHLLTGTAWFVPYASVAGDLLVIARREGSDTGELTAFLVATSTPGVATERLETTGLTPQHRVDLTDARVPATQMLGGGDAGRAVSEMAVAHGTAALCVEMVGGAQRVLDMSVEYATQRQQFGRAVGSFQAVQHHCAGMAIDVLGSSFAAYEAAWRLDRGVDASQELSVAKSWVSDAYRRVCSTGHQVHGAIGFTREHDLHLYFRHATESELTVGDAEHHRGQLAGQLFAAPPRPT